MSIHLQTPDYIVVYVSDMDRSVKFYRDTLGIPMKMTSPGWTEFNTGTTTLALHRAFGQHAESPNDIVEGKAQSPVGQAQIGFVVDNLQAVYEELRGQGVRFSMAPETQPRGLTFAVLHDPDGQAILLQQREQK